ncbi:MAG: hypothetical protein ACO3RM_11270 [Paracoccaceae bacterium]|jgi:hypothetical protein
MAKISVEQRALQAMALFEQTGRIVVNVKIKGQEISFTFKDDAEPANSLHNLMEAKFAKTKKA